MKNTSKGSEYSMKHRFYVYATTNFNSTVYIEMFQCIVYMLNVHWLFCQGALAVSPRYADLLGSSSIFPAKQVVKRTWKSFLISSLSYITFPRPHFSLRTRYFSFPNRHLKLIPGDWLLHVPSVQEAVTVFL